MSLPQWMTLRLSGLNRPAGSPPRSRDVMLLKTAAPLNRKQRRLASRMQRRAKTTRE